MLVGEAVKRSIFLTVLRSSPTLSHLNRRSASLAFIRHPPFHPDALEYSTSSAFICTAIHRSAVPDYLPDLCSYDIIFPASDLFLSFFVIVGLSDHHIEDFSSIWLARYSQPLPELQDQDPATTATQTSVQRSPGSMVPIRICYSFTICPADGSQAVVSLHSCTQRQFLDQYGDHLVYLLPSLL